MMIQYIQLQENDMRRILSKYGLKLISYEGIEGGAGNTNYFVKTEDNQYVLTILEIDPQRAMSLCKLLELLEKTGFPTTRLLKLENGDLNSSFHEKPVIVKPYIAGQVVCYLNNSMLRQLGAMIANLHAVPAPNYLPDHHPYAVESFPKVTNQGIDIAYEKWLRKKCKFLQQSIPSSLPSGLLHGDVFFDNVLFEGNQLKALIDFEEACHYTKIFDLGMAILGTCVSIAEVAFPKARSLVAGYQSIRKLEKQERDNLQLFVEYAAIGTSKWRFWKFNIDTPLDKYADRHWELANIANTISDIPKQEFLSSVFG